jgi:hypothetical protein
MLRESPFGSLPVSEVSLYFYDAIFQKHGCALGHLKIPVCVVLDLLVKDFLAHLALCLPAMRIGGRVILKPLGPLGPQRSQDCSLCAVGQVQSLIVIACHWCP